MDLDVFIYWAVGGLGAVFVLWLGQFLPRRVRTVASTTVVLLVIIAAYHAVQWQLLWDELRRSLMRPF